MGRLSVLAFATLLMSTAFAAAGPWSFNIERLMAAWATDKCTVEEAARLVEAAAIAGPGHTDQRRVDLRARRQQSTN